MNWVFIRGLTRGHSHWGEFSDMFKNFFEGSEITFLDLPGNGFLHHQKSPTSIQKLLDQCLKNLDPKTLESPRYLLGFSLGGMVSLEWMVQRPGDFDGAVLINTSASNLSPFYRRMRIGNLPRIFKSLFKGRKDWNSMIWELTTRIAKDREKVLAYWEEQAKKYPVTTLNAVRQLYAASRYRYHGPKPKSPILFLSGRQDKLVHSTCSEKLSHLVEAPLRVHGSAGHDLTLEDPTWVLRTIQDWLFRLESNDHE